MLDVAENKFFQSPLDKLIEESKNYELPNIPAPTSTAQDDTAPAPEVKLGKAASSLKKNGLMPPQDLQPLFEEASAEFGVPMNVLAALAQQESRYNSTAVGVPTKWGRAKGMLQYIDPTANTLGINPFDAKQSIRAAAAQFRDRLDQGYSIAEAIAAHHGGDDRKQWGPKTQQYVSEVMGKAGKIGEGYAKGANLAQQSFDLGAIQSELDQQEPGRYKVLTPEEAARYQEREQIAFNPDPLGQAQNFMKQDIPSPLLPGTTTPAAAPTPLTIENQRRVEAGIAPKDTREQPADGFFGSVGKALSNVPENLKNSAGGLIRSVGEGIDDQSLIMNAQRAGIIQRMKDRGEIVMKPQGLANVPQPFLKDGTFAGTSELAAYIRQNADSLMTPDEAASLVGMKPGPISQYGKGMSDQARKDMVQINPDGPLAKYGSMIIGSTAEMLPALTAAVITKNPMTAMGIMGGQVYGQSYDRAREAGKNPDQAAAYATMQAAAEAIPEALPLHFILKPGQQFFKGILSAGAAEALQEGVTGAIQAAIDKGTVDPNMTWAEARQQIIDSMIVGAGSGATMRAGIHGLEKLTAPAQSPAEQPTATPAQPEQTTTPETQAQTTPNQAEPAQPAPADQAQDAAPAANEPPPLVVNRGADGNAAPTPPQGPLQRSAAKATQTEGADRVVVHTPTGPVSGTLEGFDQGPNGAWNARVLGDDGQFYQYTDKDGVQIAPETAPAATEAAPAAEQQAQVEQLRTTEQVKPVEEPELVEQPQAEAQQEVKPEPVEQPKEEPAAEPAVEPVVAVNPEPVEKREEKRYEDMSEEELRARLKYLAGQAKATGGWNPMLMAERKKVEKAINAVVAAKSAAPAEQPTEQKPVEQPKAETKPEQPVEQPKVETAATTPTGKWFGTQEKADAFLAKKGDENLVIVPISRSRFEIHEKAKEAAPVEQQQEPAAVEPAATTGSLADSWDTMSAAEREEIAKRAGWSTSKGTLNPQGRQIIRRPWADMPELTRKNLEKGLHAAEEEAGNGPQDDRARAQQPPAELPKVETKPITVKKEPGITTIIIDPSAGTKPAAQPAKRKPAEIIDNGATNPGEFIVRDAGSNLARFEIGKNGQPVKIKHFYESQSTRDFARESIDAFLQERAKQPAKPEQPAEPAAETKPKDQRKKLGPNRNGHPLYEDENGVRFYVESGIRITESVSVIPGRGMSVDIARRGADFKTADELKAEKPAEQPKAEQPAVTENKIFTEDAAEKARAILRSKLSQLNSGIDPEIMQAGITLAGYHIEKGARTFAAYAKAMVEDMGDMVRPYLKSWYMGVKYDPRAAGFDGMSGAADVDSADLDALLAPETPATGEKPAAEVKTTETTEENRDDSQASPQQPGRSDQGAEPAGVQANEGQRPAGDVSGQPDGRVHGKRGQRAPKGSERGTDAGEPGQGAKAEQRVPGDRGDRTEPVRGDDQRNYRIQPGELKRTGSWRSTAEQNVRIVETVKKILAEGRPATAEEKALLTKFTGWGASEIANGIFPNQYGRYKDAAWEELGKRLEAALTPEEYAQAKRTTQYAHYTSEPIIRSVYNAMDRMGFNGGQVLEPGMGVGLFNGLMPDSMVPHSTYTGIEYDTITGNIAKLLYPESNVIVGDFTATKLPKDFFDAAIGNPPFGQIKIQSDPEYRKQGFLLHDYFFAKTIDRVKPGGLLVFVTSKGTMDKASDRARKYLSERADLMGAIRLPQTAFKDNAGTEVVTDVIFLKKRAPGQEPAGESWQELAEIQTPQGPAHINEYFARHPEMVLGKHALSGSMYRANEYTVEPIEGDIEELFAKAVQNLPENVYRPERGSKAEAAAVQRRDYDPKIKKEGGVYVADDGALMQVDQGQGVPLTSRIGSNGKEIELKPREAAFLKGWTGLRDALKQAQYDQLNEGAWEKSLKALNKAYDAFVKEHGQILSHTVTERENEDGSVTVTRRFKNEPLIRLDAEGALAYALETINPDGSISKGPVLNGRTLNKPTTPKITSVQDAMFVALNDTGRFDLDDIAKRAGKTREEAIAELGNEVYEDPSTGWTTADEYLSGNVRRKLKEAESAARLNKAYERNVEALKNVQPRALAPQDITVQLGSTWVPASDVENFAAEVMGERFKVAYNPVTGQWDLMGQANRLSEWGTGDKKSIDILEAVLNHRQLKVTYRDAEGKTHTDAEGTEKVNDIAKKLKAEFKRWIWTDAKRADRLAKYYNENFNNIAPRKFDGSHLTLPGVSTRFQLRPHQKRAIWRTIQQGDVYYAHAVGAGKTFTMIASGMEERRLGLAKKPMYVVPNHMLAQFSKEFLELYPTAQIMVADEQNFHTHNRRKFVAQAALNDPDAIVITHSAFGRIGMSPEFSQKFIENQIDEWKAALDEVDNSDRVTRKQIERRIEQLENRLKAIISGDKKDSVLNFEELGVDRLYVDEGHEFRKLDFPTNRGNIKGIDPSGSQRAMDLHMKVQYLRGKNPNRALVMASGTPVTNTMGELFTVQRYFQPAQLEEDGDASFDSWSGHYGEVVEGLEQNAAGGYETVARFAKFVNVPELMSRVRSFMDILTSQQLGDLVQRPDVENGGRKVIVTPVPDGYKEYQKSLESRIKAIKNRKGPPKKGEDIILKVIADGRFSAIDMRFVDPTLPSDPNSKLNLMLDDMIRVYHETADHEYATDGKVDPVKGASLMMFTDIGLGEQSAESRGFDMKAWIEKRLVEGGVKREHIAFMRDNKAHAKKERLFADLRQGKKRILIGGKDMETGVNAQKRLAWLGHLDAPWFPASVEQREGRIVRQGNQNKSVTINAYATKGSYDSTMWGMNARKARFIEQAMSGDTSVRSMEDVSEASAFEMAAALASGDERYLKLAGLKGDVERLSRLYSAHLDEQRRLRSEKMGNESAIKFNKEQIAELEAAIAKRQPIKAGEFAGTVDGKSFDKRDDFSTALFGKFKELAEGYTAGEQVIGQIGGFDVVYNGVEMRGGNFAADAELDLPGNPEPLVTFPIDPAASVAGIATRAVNQVMGLDYNVTKRKGLITDYEEAIAKIDRRLGAAFPEQAELKEKREALDELERELEAESKAAEAAQAAEVAAATQEVEGEPEAPKFSLRADIDREQQIPVAKIETFDVAPDALYATAMDYYKSNVRGDTVMNDAIGAIEFNKDTGGKVLSVGWRDPVRMSIVKALPQIAENAIPLRFDVDRKGRATIEGMIQAVAPVAINGKTYAVLLKMRRYSDGRTKAYFVEGFELGVVGGGAAGPSVQLQQRQDTASRPLGVAADESPEYRAGGLSAALGTVSTGDLIDAINAGQRAFSDLGQNSVIGKAMEPAAVRAAVIQGRVGGIVGRLIDAGQIVIHADPSTLPETLGRSLAGVQAATAPDGKIHLVASNLTPSTAQAVLLHEAFHSGAKALVGSQRWGELMDRLGQLYRQAERSTGKAREFFDRAAARVDFAQNNGAVANGLEAEEFGAYLIEEYETAPAAFRKWVDDIIGAVKAWLFSRFGRQLGQVTPAQLRALAREALVRRGTELPTTEAPRFSVLPDETALEDATKALDEKPEQYKPDFIGQIHKDIGRIARVLLHPRQIAALHSEFTPVYRTAVNQFEMRDSIIDEFQTDHKAYDVLPQKSKERVNAVLELGRLLSATYGEKQLRDGVVNPGQKSVVKFTEGGSTYRSKEKIHALLSAEGEVLKLSDSEIQAYLGLRDMFDKALDKFRDQTLADFGFPELVGEKNATKAILDMITPTSSAAEVERLQGIARFVQEIEQAKRTGYVPFARYGEYVVAVKEQQFELNLIHDPDSGGWITRDLPTPYKKFLDEIGAKYDELEGGYRLDRNQRQALIKENERTIHSQKVEFTLQDKALLKMGKPVEELPSVKKALAEAEKWKDGKANRRIVAFEAIQKKPEGGVKLSDVDALAEVAMLDTETWDAVRDQLADAIKGKSFRKHFFQADNVPGYTADFERAIADYMGGMAGYLARRHYNRAWDDAIAKIKAPRLFDYANKYRAYANEPQEELAMLRQIGFFHYIAGVPATAFVNLTQPMIMTVPVLSQIAPMHTVIANMARAYKDALAMVRFSKRVGLDFFDPSKAPADIRVPLMKAWAEGMFVPLQTYEVMATARSRNVGNRQIAKYFNKGVQATASLFSFAERLNRLVTFIASARLAGKEGVKARAQQVYGRNALARQTFLKDWNASTLADFMIDETQFRMGKANRAGISRGMGAVIMQFKGFVMQSLESWFRLATQNGAQGVKAVAMSIGAMVLLGGLWGFPGADDLRDLIEKAYKQVTKQDLDLKTELRKGIYDLTGQRWLSEVASKGATYPFGLDLTRVGMGNVTPDAPLQVFGIPADLFIGRPTRAFEKANQGDTFGAVAEFLPNFLKNPVTAYGWNVNGVRDGVGRLILDSADVGTSETALKSLGFQPSKITDIRDYEYAQRRMETANDQYKRDLTSRLVRSIVKAEKHPDQAAEAMEEQDKVLAEIEAHNAKAKGPEDMIVITRRSLKGRVQQEMEGVQSTWGKERKQARGASENLREVFGLSEE